MTTLVHELISHSVQRSPEAIALQVKNISLSYAQLDEKVTKVAQGYASLAITHGDRIGIYLAKNQENVQSMFACSLLGAVFVPINPVLKPNKFTISLTIKCYFRIFTDKLPLQVCLN